MSKPNINIQPFKISKIGIKNYGGVAFEAENYFMYHSYVTLGYYRKLL